tara:strand:+ start:497 stop:955 length:459 start_codon:yes stop_codon:yes gene_type:complete
MKHNQEKQQIQHVLAMLEENPTDAGVLDEVDARVQFIDDPNHKWASPLMAYHCNIFEDAIEQYSGMKYAPDYARCVTSQKSLEVEGWFIEASPRFFCEKYDDKTMFRAWAVRPKGSVPQEDFYNLQSPVLLTEPLARLHAWMQVRLWEIENG